jgi:hypothetical protein
MRCAVAYNLRRFYNFRSAFPFDWWITPAEGVAAFLEHPDADYLYDMTQLELVHAGKTVKHRELGFRLHHEFSRDEGTPGQPVRPGWQGAIADPKSRTVALMDKFLGLNTPGNRIAFVREKADGFGDRIAGRLNKLFPLADYTLIELSRVPGSNEDSFGWKGDPARWNETLAPLDLSLDRTHHQSFEGKRIIHSDHSQSVSAHAH